MKVAKEINSNYLTSRNLGLEALYYIATLPEEQKQEELAKEIPNVDTFTHLGKKALYLIATLPEEQKQEELSKDLTFNHLDIDKDFANKFMKVAKGLSNLPTLANIVSKDFARKFMTISSKLPNRDTWSNLGNRALYLIATLPEEERTDERRVRR